jgi:hypothetical protein
MIPAPLTGWRIGDAGFTVFGPKTDEPAPRIILTGKDRAAVRLAAAAPDLLDAAREAAGLLACNCGRICEKTCTYARLTAAVEKAEGGR